jgi:hypothetical protein
MANRLFDRPTQHERDLPERNPTSRDNFHFGVAGDENHAIETAVHAPQVAAEIAVSRN